MSKYTTEIRFLCEVNAGLVESVGYTKIEETIQKAAPKIFDFDFPIFDESYRTVLETKIIRHFYTREICCETVALWKLYLCDKMNMIMPYYNQLYKSELLEFNPLYDVDITRERDVTGSEDKDNTVTETDKQNSTTNNNQTGEYTDSSNSTSMNLYSDTPQGAINNVENGDYLTNVTKDTNSGSSNGNNTVTNTGESTFDGNRNVKGNETIATTEKYLEKVSGKQGTVSYSELILKYRQTFLNIDQMVINELETLFMGVW